VPHPCQKLHRLVTLSLVEDDVLDDEVGIIREIESGACIVEGQLPPGPRLGFDDCEVTRTVWWRPGQFAEVKGEGARASISRTTPP